MRDPRKDFCLLPYLSPWEVLEKFNLNLLLCILSWMYSCLFGMCIIIFLNFILEPNWKVSRQTFGFLLAHKLGNGCSIMGYH